MTSDWKEDTPEDDDVRRGSHLEKVAMIDRTTIRLKCDEQQEG